MLGSDLLSIENRERSWESRKTMLPFQEAQARYFPSKIVTREDITSGNISREIISSFDNIFRQELTREPMTRSYYDPHYLCLTTRENHRQRYTWCDTFLLFPQDPGFNIHELDKNGNNLLAYCNSEDLFYFLLERGIDVHNRNRWRMTALHYAEHIPRCVPLLLSAGLNINCVDRHGKTPLFYCKTSSSVDLLLSLGADPSVRDIKGHTVIYYSRGKLRQYYDTLSCFRQDSGTARPRYSIKGAADKERGQERTEIEKDRE